MISYPNKVYYCECADQRCYRLGVVTIGSKDIVLEYTVPEAPVTAAGATTRTSPMLSQAARSATSPRTAFRDSLAVKRSLTSKRDGPGAGFRGASAGAVRSADRRVGWSEPQCRRWNVKRATG